MYDTQTFLIRKVCREMNAGLYPRWNMVAVPFSFEEKKKKKKRAEKKS